MKKSEMIDAIAKETGVTKTDVEKVFNATFETIKKDLKKNEKSSIANFGTFKVSKRAARTGRNPQTGAEVKIPARTAVTFKAGSALKDAVN